MKISEVISRIRGQIKALRQEAFITDRYIYSIYTKHAKWLMKREDSKNKLMQFSSIMQTLDNVELIEIDNVEANCIGLKSGIKMMRTKEKIPVFMQGYWGPLIRQVTSIDGQINLQPTMPSQYISMTKSKSFKYNKTQYYWYLNDYLYFPNLIWKTVRIEGVFEDDISSYKCADCPSSEFYCKPRQEQTINIPDYLYGEIESNVLKDLSIQMQIPMDNLQDNKNVLR